MITHRATNFPRLIQAYWRRLLIVLAIVAVVELANGYLQPGVASLNLQTLGLLTTALSIFLVFRVNEAYSRWWEARTLWGGLVNQSRTLARQATTLLVSPDGGHAEATNETAAIKRAIVYRHIAYLNALRMNLRRQADWASLAPLLCEDELSGLLAANNKPTQLIQNQATQLAQAHTDGMVDSFGRLMIDGTLTELYNLQGGCERIKNTVFPDRIAYLTELTAWMLAVLIPLSVIQVNARWDTIDLIVVPAMVMVLLITERFGAELKNPFENRPNDTPMTALCRTIEIDLRQQLGETELPPPIEPSGGVLM